MGFGPEEDELIATASYDQTVESERIIARRVRLISHGIGRQRDRDLAAHLERLGDPGAHLLGPGHQSEDLLDLGRFAIEVALFKVGEREPPFHLLGVELGKDSREHAAGNFEVPGVFLPEGRLLRRSGMPRSRRSKGRFAWGASATVGRNFESDLSRIPMVRESAFAVNGKQKL